MGIRVGMFLHAAPKEIKLCNLYIKLWLTAKPKSLASRSYPDGKGFLPTSIVFPRTSLLCWRCNKEQCSTFSESILWYNLFWSKVKSIILNLTGIKLGGDQAAFLYIKLPLPAKPQSRASSSDPDGIWFPPTSKNSSHRLPSFAGGATRNASPHFLGVCLDTTFLVKS